MTETQTLQRAKRANTLPPHFFCDCVPDLGPAHCHRCTQSSDNGIVEWRTAPCRDLVTSFAYNALLTAGVDDSLLLISAAFDLEREEERDEAEMVTTMAEWLSEPPAPDEVPTVAVTTAKPDVAASAAERTVLKAVPAPPKSPPLLPQNRPAERTVVGPWRFTDLARGQISALNLTKYGIVTILEGAHVKTPSHSGTAMNHYGDGLLIMVDSDGACIISVIKLGTPLAGGPGYSPTAAASSTNGTAKQKTHSGGAGRRIPSNLKEFVSMLSEHGFVTELGGKGHYLTTHPLHPAARVSVPSSPSDTRSYKNTLADIKRLTGIDITMKKD